MPDQDDELRAPEAEQIESRRRLKHARETAGKGPQDLGSFVGGTSNYHDIENCNGELYMAPSLGELAALCLALGIKTRDVFDHRSPIVTEPSISPENLIARIKDYVSKNAISVAEFENRVGFEIGPSLNDTSKLMDWTVDFLRWLCRELGLDWRLALP